MESQWLVRSRQAVKHSSLLIKRMIDHVLHTRSAKISPVGHVNDGGIVCKTMHSQHKCILHHISHHVQRYRRYVIGLLYVLPFSAHWLLKNLYEKSCLPGIFRYIIPMYSEDCMKVCKPLFPWSVFYWAGAFL